MEIKIYYCDNDNDGDGYYYYCYYYHYYFYYCYYYYYYYYYELFPVNTPSGHQHAWESFVKVGGGESLELNKSPGICGRLGQKL